MPDFAKKIDIQLQHTVPGASSLALNEFCRDGKTYHDVISELCSSPFLIHGWNIAAGYDDIPQGSIAYHPIFGDIRYGYSYRYPSVMKLIENLKAAENNDSISAHIIHIDSCGGQAFGLHEAYEVISSLKKPCYAVIESTAASAAYYLALGCDKIFTTSAFSKIGSIGVMTVFIDRREELKMDGIKIEEILSNYSPLKNQDARNLENGEYAEYIKKYLDPVAKAFIEDVLKSRKAVSADSDALKGELYLAEEAIQIGLVDDVCTLDGAIDKLAKKIAPKAPAQAPAFDINKLNF